MLYTISNGLDLNGRPNTMKPPEENIEEKFSHISMSNEFLDITSKAQATKEKIIK